MNLSEPDSRLWTASRSLKASKRRFITESQRKTRRPLLGVQYVSNAKPGNGGSTRSRKDGCHACIDRGIINAAHQIGLGFYDGEMLRSERLETFYYCGNSNLDRQNSPVPAQDASSQHVSSDNSSCTGSPATKSRTPSPTFERSCTPTSSRSNPTVVSGTPKSACAAARVDTTAVAAKELSFHTQKQDDNPQQSAADSTATGIVILNSCIKDGTAVDVCKGYAALPGKVTAIPIVAKIALTARAIDALEHEHYVYQHLETDSSLPVPETYGYYRNTINSDGKQVGILLLSCIDGAAPQSKEELRQLKPSIYRAVAQLHHHGVVHCDLAPRNILVNEGQITLLDFECADVHGGVLADVDTRQLEDFLNEQYLR